MESKKLTDEFAQMRVNCGCGAELYEEHIAALCNPHLEKDIKMKFIYRIMVDCFSRFNDGKYYWTIQSREETHPEFSWSVVASGYGNSYQEAFTKAVTIKEKLDKEY